MTTPDEAQAERPRSPDLADLAISHAGGNAYAGATRVAVAPVGLARGVSRACRLPIIANRQLTAHKQSDGDVVLRWPRGFPVLSQSEVDRIFAVTNDRPRIEHFQIAASPRPIP